ncbi:MAG: hypothetical protein JWM41_2609 [Gemmatimonadetes bacterium]|nr:hypothetical protein [Gemmatimonadota bacterium]
MKRSSIVLGVSLGAMAFATACGKRDTKPPPMPDMPGMGGMARDAKPSADTSAHVTFTAAQIQHGGVIWGPVAVGTASGTATVPGEVTPNEDRTARLGAPARGRVVSVSIRPGDRVSAGQPLVTLQSPEAGTAQSDVAKADAEVASRKAEAQYAASARGRAERLLALKAIPRQDVERAVADDDHARAALAQAEAEARRARSTAAQLSAGGASGEIVLRAPAAGLVLTRTAVPGVVVEAGAPLVVITDPANLWLTINAPEQMAALFHRGGHIRFSVPAFPTDTFAATVDAVGAGLDPETRTLGVRAVIANAGRLKPQMLASVVVDGGGTAAAALVPEAAVQTIQGKSYVFLAHPDGKGGARFDRREVVLGTRSGGRVAVLRGLAAGDVVVTAGAFAVKAELQKATMPKMEM